MKLLGIDYGKKHVGVAYSDGIYSQPLIELFTGEAMVRLVKICQELQIEKVVVGKPEGSTISQVQQFVDVLKTKLTCPVVFWDETLSTKAAAATLIARGAAHASRKAKEHVTAAAFILQSYLDSIS